MSLLSETTVTPQPPQLLHPSPTVDVVCSPLKRCRLKEEEGQTGVTTRTDFHHLRALAQKETYVDHLRLLYPHMRDDRCVMHEATHKYFIDEKPYDKSVTAVWGAFFPSFDSGTMSIRCLQKAQRKGLCDMGVSVYNLLLFIQLVERTSLEEVNRDAVLRRCGVAIDAAMQWFLTQGGSSVVTEAELREQCSARMSQMRKPDGASCYFLVHCLGATAQQLTELWTLNGEIESMKGTLLHKQVELFLQEWGKHQRDTQKKHLPLGALWEDVALLAQVLKASSFYSAMKAVVLHQGQPSWDHPALQDFLRSALHVPATPEFSRFLSWARSKPLWSPYRSEWSIFNEDWKLAGQIDSLWYTGSENRVVMADWKRCKEFLTMDENKQRKMVFGKQRGLVFHPNSSMPGPCRALFDVSANHYLVQQNIYSAFLAAHYDVTVEHLYLVQCHPNIGDTVADFNEVLLPNEPDLVAEVLAAFADGWNGAEKDASAGSSDTSP